MYVYVLIELKVEQLDKTFTYHVPQNLRESISVGVRVTVPFGKQSLEGFVLNIEDNFDADYPVKDILDVVDDHPVLNEELLELGRYMRQKTLCNLIGAYTTMLPAALKTKYGRTINKKMVSYVNLNLPYEEAIVLASNEQQRRIVECLGDGEVKKSDACGISSSAIQTLLKKGIIQIIEKEEYRLEPQLEEISARRELTEEQMVALNTIKIQNEFQTYLLHGVTGSGKTEVYLRLIEKVIRLGKEAIVLVPEISLTPQVVGIFGKRFGEQIAILHSGLSDGEKYDEWRKIERREVSIVIGARSAIFAPFNNLGIIIIDEEHSTTYKQENTPRYNTIDIALWRAKRHQIPLILGSATPSIESYTRAKMGVYKLLEMKKRVNNNLPSVNLLDMREEYKKGCNILSRKLKENIIDRLEKKEQVILLLNRRGFSTVLRCKSCGYTEKCPRCDIPLTYHKKRGENVCHYCGYSKPRLWECPSCKKEKLADLGMGTEKLEQYLGEEFKNARILRMDNDTTSNKGSHKRMIQSFEQGDYDILIGTQMIAKGLDFPRVTLVGVVNGDSTLNLPDFRSAERTYQLLSQVAGRAGRGEKKGEVIIQGFNMDHYSMIATENHDYIYFYNQEMKIRKKLNYSPYCNLIVLTLKGKKEELLYEEGNKIVKHLISTKKENVSILGPTGASIPKVNFIYEVQIIIKCKKKDWIYKESQFLKEVYRKNRNLTFDVDFDPIYI